MVKYTDIEMKKYLEELGYIIDNESDLSEMAINEGFKWDEKEEFWY